MSRCRFFRLLHDASILRAVRIRVVGARLLPISGRFVPVVVPVDCRRVRPNSLRKSRTPCDRHAVQNETPKSDQAKNSHNARHSIRSLGAERTGEAESCTSTHRGPLIAAARARGRIPELHKLLCCRTELCPRRCTETSFQVYCDGALGFSSTQRPFSRPTSVDLS